MAGIDLLLQDASLSATGVLSTGGSAGGTTATTFLDLGQSAFGQFDPTRTEFQLQIPVLTSTQLPNSTSHAYAIYASDAATTNASSAVQLFTVPAAGDGNINSTSTTNYALGASSGSSAFNYTFKVRNSVPRYLFAQATCSASTAANSVAMTLVCKF